MSYFQTRFRDDLLLLLKIAVGIILLRMIFIAAGYERYIPVVDDILRAVYRLADRVMP